MKNKEKYDLRDISYVIKSNNGKYDFVVYYNSVEIHREIFHGFVSTHDTFTKWLEEEYDPKILIDKEKAYLSAVIKPFRENIESVKKLENYYTAQEYIRIVMKKGTDYCSLPWFRKGTMYKGMHAYKEYTLEELGL